MFYSKILVYFYVRVYLSWGLSITASIGSPFRLLFRLLLSLLLPLVQLRFNADAAKH